MDELFHQCPEYMYANNLQQKFAFSESFSQEGEEEFKHLGKWGPSNIEWPSSTCVNIIKIGKKKKKS